MKLIRRLSKVDPLSGFLLDSDVPANFDDLDDDQLSKHIDQCKPCRRGHRESKSDLSGQGHRLTDWIDSETIYHPMSSCKIGESVAHRYYNSA